MSTALVHDYFTQRGGAEAVASRLTRLFPGAPLHTSVVDWRCLPATIAPERLRTSRLQWTGRARIPLRALGPLLPAAFAAMDLGAADTVISSSSAFAHHVRPAPGVLHVSYVHTPAAFLWNEEAYFRHSRTAGALAAPLLRLMRSWDRRAMSGVDLVVANSRFTAARLREHVGRDSVVLHPPIETGRFLPTTERSGRFLAVSRLRPHKSLDIVVRAATRWNLPLDVIGDGSDRRRLQSLAGPSVRFLGRRSDAEVAAAMARCTALVVPGVEDFGMVMAEVQAAGRPPVGVAAGGALEIIDDGVTGFLAATQSVDAVAEAMWRAATEELDAWRLRASAMRFDAGHFDAAIIRLVTSRVLTGESVGAVVAGPRAVHA